MQYFRSLPFAKSQISLQAFLEDLKHPTTFVAAYAQVMIPESTAQTVSPNPAISAN